MSRIENTVCEMCGTILRGRDKAAWVEKEHLELRGRMVLQRGPGDYVYVTTAPEEAHHFCNFGCLEDFAKMRTERYDAAQKRRLQDEATDDIIRSNVKRL